MAEKFGAPYMQIVVVGTVYVGLVTGACFSEMTNHATCVDIDKEKLETFKKGIRYLGPKNWIMG